MKISKTLSPSNVLCDRENGVITISSIDGSKIIINDVFHFQNWSEKFKSLIIEDHVCHMSDDSSSNSYISIFFEKLTNIIYAKLIRTPEEQIDQSCNDILNVVSQHIIKENLNG